MSNTSEASQSRLLKTLAVFGFIAVIIFGTWLAIKIVQMVPSAFSSLASLAESVEDGRVAQNNITVDGTTGVLNSNESFTISWSDLGRKGSYVLSYECVDGASMDVRFGNSIVTVPCETPFVLPEDTFSVEARFVAEKNRFTDIPYQISFVRAGEVEPFVTTNKLASVVNANIPQGTVLGIETEEEMKEELVEEAPVAVSEPAVSTPTPSVSTPKPPVTTIVTKTLTKPVSDPNGYTELAVKYLGVGILDSNNHFITTAEIDSDDKAAFQFEVKNTGTKTSGNWNFEADLTSGDTFKSKTQSPLKPQERTVLTIAFDNPGEEGLQEFGASISGGNDTKKTNNSFSWAIHITD